jgi:imidazolonepropionase
MIWTNANILSMAAGEYELISKAALVVENNKIAWLGRVTDLPEMYQQQEKKDLTGKLITPGFIDCHTHVVYAGNRSNEFELRLKGASYAEISKQGGGIISTVESTRSATEEVLLRESLPRVKSMIANGVTTLEIKSGYGLDLDTEIKMLKVARKISTILPVKIKTTLLAAHAVPIEYKGQADKYIDLVCQEIIPKVAELGLADAVDAFCEGIGFSVGQVEKIFTAAQKYKLPIKLHAEQLSNLGGSCLAAKYKALSADHLEYLDEAGVLAMAESGSVAVLLPGAFYFLKESHKPPVELLRQYKVPIAIATDCNPGSSPTTSLPLMLNMACILFGLTVEEALRSVTYNAAKALGVLGSTGSLEIGKDADIAIWDVASPAELVGSFGWF